ncbi:kynureninase-like isoform X3 [Acropora palmata]|uniref:kynureninase-like isoform X3 n=1 Tax=Acropora palmata TaxID=6131 RepID=UPI003DA06E56
MAAEEELIRSKCSKQLNFRPARTLIRLLKETKLQISDEAFAKFLDEQDELKNLREDFWYPKMKDLPPVDLSFVDEGADSLYFCGNSLGIQPKEAGVVVKEEMEKWQKMSLYGHFHGKYPWWIIEDFAVSKTTKLVGAKEIEVAIMNSLTVNLHLLLVPFYRPNPQRHKVLLEAKTFPSDHYAIQSQIRYHGYDPAESIVEVVARKDEEILRTEDIISIIEEQGDSIALVMFPGVHYYTGQFFDIEKITAAAQKKGCVVGWDLAHAVGNVELKLHDWNVDFACWCSYKYLNGGPGAVAGAFIHERHAYNFDLPKFAGWWGQNRKKRFEMGHVVVEVSFKVNSVKMSFERIFLIRIRVNSRCCGVSAVKSSIIVNGGFGGKLKGI